MPSDLEVLLPKRVADPGSIQLSPRPESLDGKVLGFIWNSKPNADVLFEEFVSRTSEQFSLTDVKRFRKPSAAVGAKDEIYDRIESDCDVAVVAVGD